LNSITHPIPKSQNMIKLEKETEGVKADSDESIGRKASFGDIAKKIMNSLKGKKDKNLMQKHLTNFFFKNAYIITNGCMMVWSVLYHSIFAYIMLIWANLIWVRKDQRIMMMKSSPFLVIYSVVLVTMNYLNTLKYIDVSTIFGFKDVLPVGIVKELRYPGIHLLIKCGFLVSFWLTSRLMFQEKLIEKHRKVLTFEERVRAMMEIRKEGKRKAVSTTSWYEDRRFS
jgi:hypothetical protein